MTFTSINPATGRVIARYEPQSERDIDCLLDASSRAFLAWRETRFSERAACLASLANRLRERSEELARLIAAEMGKPLPQGEAEVEKCAWVCEHYAEHAEALLAAESVETEAKRSEVVFPPLGAVLAIMPWNFPFWQFFRFAAPALMAGNVAVLRHASNVTGCALEIDKLSEEAGLPADVLRVALVDKTQVADMIADPRIAAVTLTGSVEAGRAVAAAAGGAIKKTVLELGGSDPYVILRDADLELAVERCVASRLINTGQSCIAAKRFIVEEPLLEDFVAAFVEAMRGKRTGDPLEADVDLGPLAQAKGRDRLHEQVRSSIAAGAVCVLGGEIPSSAGFFYPPTVLTAVQPGMAAFDTEVFGPVAAIVCAPDAERAIELANRTEYGLGAAVFTKDVERGREIAARRLQAGNCFVNDFVRSDPRLPFGGVKHSGYGRELGAFGIREFVNVKTVWVGGGTKSGGPAEKCRAAE
ncbi:MAG TPA: NAD-dependent succinate-semialdehyde dehydrogenase [Gammaproteobacteria bacterium]|nr:NAD-dependent succinate-semialdehyde dehydrogenase [Gammaproteobacteria bacterium]